MTIRNSLAALTLGISAASAPALANAEAPDQYFLLNPYLFDPSGSRLAKDSVGMDMAYGRQLRGPFLRDSALEGSLYAELRGFHVLMERNAGGLSSNTGIGLDLHYLLGERGQWAGLAIGGLAYAYNDVDSPASGSSIQGNLGLGLLSPSLTSAEVRLRLDGRVLLEDFDGGKRDYRIGVGLEIPLAKKRVEVREVVVEKRVEVEVPVPAPAAAPVIQRDSDNDGISDAADRCPASLPDIRVDESGCAVKFQRVRLSGVNFESNSNRFKPESMASLQRAVMALKGQPDLKIIIAGHSDSTGKAAYNKALSQARAEAVRQYLLSQGIAADRMRAVGYGEAQPIASNDTAAGRALNRRVEFEISN